MKNKELKILKHLWSILTNLTPKVTVPIALRLQFDESKVWGWTHGPRQRILTYVMGGAIWSDWVYQTTW